MTSNLFNPQKFQEPISLEGYDDGLLKKALSSMILIRKTEQQLALAK